METETLLVVGLGNPGLKYMHTRHNVGFDVINVLLKRWDTYLDQNKFSGMIREVRIDGKRVVLCEPQTFMNLSGECCIQLLNWYKCPLENMLVIYDDIDLPAARLRMRLSGSAGTHNGMRSILEHVPGSGFPRLRVGTGRPREGWELVDWVLSRYQPGEEDQAMRSAFEHAADCVETWIHQGASAAMQQANQPVPDPRKSKTDGTI